MTASPILRQFLPSLTGLARLVFSHPVFAVRLSLMRAQSVLRREVRGELSTPDGYRISTLGQLYAYWGMFLCRDLWHPRWIDELRKAQAPVVLDVGANYGLFTHLACTLNPAARVWAFEPQELPAKAVRDASRCADRITVIRKAVSDTDGSAQLSTGSADDGMASLESSSREGLQSLRVETTRLDSVEALRSILSILVMKIDVEGHECAVLRGAPQTLRKTRYLIVEANTPEALAGVKEILGAGWATTQVGFTDYLFYRAGA